MNTPASSLNNLHDIVAGPAPGPWPFATGVWVLAFLVLLVALALAGWARRRWHRLAYRRAGLALLAKATTVREVNITLKRVALAVFPRAQVAGLYGTPWLKFLQTTDQGIVLPGLIGSETGAAPTPELLHAAAAWIRHHRVPRIQLKEEA